MKDVKKLQEWLQYEIRMAKNELQHYPITQPLYFNKDVFFAKWESRIKALNDVLKII